MRADEHDLPIHGALAAAEDWDVIDAGADADAAWLAAALDYGRRDDRLAVFPFPHRLELELRLAGDALTITTTVVATGDDAVPLAFGWHPWLSLPGVPRAEWELSQPARVAVALDDRKLPTGERTDGARRARAARRPRARHPQRSAGGRALALSGGGREIAVEWAGGYRYAQVFAPTTLDVACLEPMMAPVAALSTGEALRSCTRASGSARRSACASPEAARRVGDDVRVAIGRSETTVSEEHAPVVRVDVLETFVELLTRSEDDGSSDAFYSSLCEAVCRLTSLDRAVIFRYDEARRRVRAAGAYGLDLDRFADSHVTVESAPIARQALVEDRVIEMDADAVARSLPERFRDLIDGSTLVCCPLSAGGRWSGVILADRRPRRPLSGEERDLLWTLGKSAALAEAARHATFQQARARQLQERIDLAREVHEGVIQRLFGVLLVVSSDAPLPDDARERVTVELQAGLRDLRRALQRPLGRSSPATETTLRDELARLRGAHPELGIGLTPGSEEVGVPRRPGAARAVGARRGRPERAQARGADACRGDPAATGGRLGDGGLQRRRAGRSRTISGMGLRLAALEALQVGGLVEFGEREPGSWRVRLAVPHERA